MNAMDKIQKMVEHVNAEYGNDVACCVLSAAANIIECHSDPDMQLDAFREGVICGTIRAYNQLCFALIMASGLGELRMCTDCILDVMDVLNELRRTRRKL